MSRSRHFIHSVASGYLALGVNVLYTIVSIPLALHYLAKEEFGIWAVTMQISAYLALIEAGMTGSVYRLLIDHKDQQDAGEYGRILSTGAVLFVIQGTLMALAGTALNPLLVNLLQIPPHLQTTFYWVNSALCATIGFGVATRTLSIPLMSHQRMDIMNALQTGQFIIQFAVLWVGFHLGWGIWAMVGAAVVSAAFNSFSGTFMAWRLKLLPSRSGWSRPRWETFLQVAGFGRDVFLLTVGWQLVQASPMFIIARAFGLESAAVWAVCTKTFSLVQQLVWRILDFSIPGLTEMFVRGETERLKNRFREIVIVTASMSILAAGIAAACNNSFVQLWTRGKISWPWANDIGMGAALVVYSITRCFMMFGGITKQIGSLRYVYLLEAALVSVFGWWIAPYYGFTGIIAVTILSDVLCSGGFGLARVERYFELPHFSVVTRWLEGPWRLLLVFASFAALISWLAIHLTALPKLSVSFVLTAAFGAICFWFFGVPKSLRSELLARLKRFRPKEAA